MAYKYARGPYFNSDYLENEIVLANPCESLVATDEQYYANQTSIGFLQVQNLSFVTNEGTVSSGTIKDQGTLYVTGGSAADITMENGGWLGMTIDDAYEESVNFSVSAASATESFDFSYQNTGSVSDLLIPSFAGLAVEGTIARTEDWGLDIENENNFWVQNITVNGRLEIDGVVADDISVLSGGGIVIHMGTAVNDLSISNGGNAFIKNDVARSVVFTGDLCVAGSLHLHNFQYTTPESVATVSGTLIFDLADRLPSDTSVMVDSLDSLVCNSFAISVSADQEDGTYLLAENASETDIKISVLMGDTEMGEISLEQTLTVNGKKYALSNANNTLSCSVAQSSPVQSDRVIVASGELKMLVTGGTYTCPAYEGSGGACYVAASGTLTGTKVVFENNSAIFSGLEILNLGCGGAICNAGKIGLSNVTFNNNNCEDGRGGGAIYNYKGEADISGANFSNNSSDGGGGAIGIYYATMTISNADFANNTTGTHGGAVENYEGIVSFTDVCFTNNFANGDSAASWYYGYGGAIYNNGTATLKNVVFTGNYAKTAGGALDNHGTIDFSGESIFFSCNTSSYGGAICNQGIINFNSSKTNFVSNATNNAMAHGGAIRNDGGEINFFGSVSFSGNTACMGGAIQNKEEGIINFYNNVSFDQNYSNHGWNGGALTVDGIITFSGDSSIFNHNISTCNGGAIACSEDGLVEFSGESVIFADNTATVKGGALVNFGTVRLNADNITFNGNTAACGGAIYNWGSYASDPKGTIIHLAGTVNLQTASDTWVNEGTDGTYSHYATTDWDLTNAAPGNSVCINNFQYFSNVGDYTKMTITVSASQQTGNYIIATGDLSDLTGKNSFILTDGGDKQQSIVVGDNNVSYNGRLYSLATVSNALNSTLVLSVAVPVPYNLQGTEDGVSWEGASGKYVVEYSTDQFDRALSVQVSANGIDTFAMPENAYQWRVRNSASDIWAESAFSASKKISPKKYVSEANDIDDIFFANPSEIWAGKYVAQHIGYGDWNGTQGIVSLTGKNKIADTFTGSNDANILVLTDDANGDALFVDDIYTAFPDEWQSRIAQIEEIRAGAGDDVVDMTSQRFEYIGDGVVIRGGSGNDTIWANKGSNILFGDAGDDRIVGGQSGDVLTGGIGNDSLNGGGGNDIFCFCDDWGKDTVEQISGGAVTLWFNSGNKDCWNQETMTYTNGANTVKVTGALQVALIFGDDGSSQYDELVSSGCFLAESSKKVFEETSSGMLA